MNYLLKRKTNITIIISMYSLKKYVVNTLFSIVIQLYIRTTVVKYIFISYRIKLQGIEQTISL